MHKNTRDVWVGGILLVASACALPDGEDSRPARRAPTPQPAPTPQIPQVLRSMEPAARQAEGTGVRPLAPVARARPPLVGTLRCKG
ncbi:MAG: hypothetical protein HY909_11975 [Deltaproteobacteria bacterium]|nr:hypothetical protein [Deltaproteobacteria bacterium]